MFLDLAAACRPFDAVVLRTGFSTCSLTGTWSVRWWILSSTRHHCEAGGLQQLGSGVAQESILAPLRCVHLRSSTDGLWRVCIRRWLCGCALCGKLGCLEKGVGLWCGDPGGVPSPVETGWSGAVSVACRLDCKEAVRVLRKRICGGSLPFIRESTYRGVVLD